MIAHCTSETYTSAANALRKSGARSPPPSRRFVGWHPAVTAIAAPTSAAPTAINVPSIPVVDPSNASPSVASLGTIPSKALRFVNFDVLTIAVLSLFCLLAVSPRLGSSIQSSQLQSDHDSFPVWLLNDMFRVRLNFRSYCE